MWRTFKRDVIEFSVSNDLTIEFRKTVMELDEEEWTPLYRVERGRDGDRWELIHWHYDQKQLTRQTRSGQAFRGRKRPKDSRNRPPSRLLGKKERLYTTIPAPALHLMEDRGNACRVDAANGPDVHCC